MDTPPSVLQVVVNRSSEESPNKLYDTQNQPIPMVIFNASGKVKTLQYFDLQEIQFDTGAPDSLTCVFSEWEVVVSGRRLLPLLDDLSRHSVFRLVADKRHGNSPEHESATFATKIEFIPRVEPPGVRNSGEEILAEDR